jgi:type I restriction enzyme M protein
MSSSAIVQKLWNYCNVLRDDGMSYGDYVEQLTYLLFLKMADERTKGPYNQPSMVPVEASWPTLIKRDGDDLFGHYRHVLEKLGNENGLLGLIFNTSQNKFQDPAKLRRLIVESRRWTLALTRATWLRYPLFTGYRPVIAQSDAPIRKERYELARTN